MPEHWSQQNRPAEESSNILDAIVEQARLGDTLQDRQESRSQLKDFVSDLAHNEMYPDEDIAQLLQSRIQALDKLIAGQMNEVLHHPEFQELESVWRGLAHLVEETPQDQGVVLQIFNTRLRELATSGLQSELRQQVIAERLDTLGADPFSALIGIFEFTRHPESFGVLRQLGSLAADARAAFLGAADPSLFGCQSFYQLSTIPKTTQELELDDTWHHFVQSRVSDRLVLALPRVLIRQPYEKDHATPRYSHDEQVDGAESSKYLWGSPLWPIAAEMAHAFAEGSWCADVNARVSQRFSSLWMYSDQGDDQYRGPLDATFGDRALNQLRASGFTPLSCDPRTNRILVEKPRTLHRGSHLLRDTIARGRLEQYILSIARELRGRVSGPEEFLRTVNHWAQANFPGDSSALRLRPVGFAFMVEGAIASIHISVPIGLYTTPAHESEPPATVMSNLEEIKPYFDLLQQAAELSRSGAISIAEQEAIKQSILPKIHRSLGSAPTPASSPTPLLATQEDRAHIRIHFDSAGIPSAADYAVLFEVIEDVHSLLCSAAFEVEAVHKASPGEIFGATFAQAAQALVQIFSLGNQLKDIRLAAVKVQDAKLDLSRKEIELNDFKRRMEARWNTNQIEDRIEAARKDAELEELRKKRDEAIRDRRKLLMDDLAQRYELISKALPVLQSLPPVMQDRFQQDLSQRLERLGDTTLFITGAQEADPPA